MRAQTQNRDVWDLTVGAGEVNGWFPEVGNADRDWVDLRICLECGQTQGDFPVDQLDLEEDSGLESDLDDEMETGDDD